MEQTGWHHENKPRKTKQEVWAAEQAISAQPPPTEDAPSRGRAASAWVPRPTDVAAGAAPREAPLKNQAPFARDDQDAGPPSPTRAAAAAPFARDDQDVVNPSLPKGKSTTMVRCPSPATRAGTDRALNVPSRPLQVPAAVLDNRAPFGVDEEARHDWHRSQEYVPVMDGDDEVVGPPGGGGGEDWTLQATMATQSSRETAKAAMARNRGSGGLW